MEDISDNDIEVIYNQLRQVKSNTPEYRKILSVFNVFREQFNNELSNKQQQILTILLQQMKDMCSTEIKEYFVEGYKRGARLMLEILNNEEE